MGPLYLLLAARFRQLIDEGSLPPGTSLPPDRTLAAAWQAYEGTSAAPAALNAIVV